MIKKIMQKYLSTSCKTAGELTEKDLAVGLTFVERAKLKMHLKMCDVCSSYQKHSVFIDQAVDKMMDESDKKEFVLPEATKMSIVDKINS